MKVDDMPNPVIEAAGLQKIYQEGPTTVRAVRGVDIVVHAGELVLLMGPSGSGKSSVLSMLGCILRPSAGELRIVGKPVPWNESTLPVLRRNCFGFVFQQFNLLAALTAAENVAMTLWLKGEKHGSLPRARAALAELGLEHRWNFYPRDLSGGEKQRVAIARALIGNPPIILADEPTGNLDSTSGRTVIEILKRVAVEQRRAVVVVTHDPRIVPYADRAIELEDGMIIPSAAARIDGFGSSRQSKRRTTTSEPAVVPSPFLNMSRYDQ
jgi:putative ABC transport system ATP-binding protein